MKFAILKPFLHFKVGMPIPWFRMLAHGSGCMARGSWLRGPMQICPIILINRPIGMIILIFLGLSEACLWRLCRSGPTIGSRRWVASSELPPSLHTGWSELQGSVEGPGRLSNISQAFQRCTQAVVPLRVLWICGHTKLRICTGT